MNLRESFEEREFQELSPYAAHSRNSRGRDRYEPECDIRTVYQRDRDRILHSKAFRRMKDKTQVFLAAQGDHYRTRLTHTLEVSQIARTIARALNLNEDLTEAIALGHDLGHTPFGHAGERALNEIYGPGFRHYEQSLRVVDCIEKDGRGLNLCQETRIGILAHTKGHPEESREAVVVRLCDHVAYLNHDLDDAMRAGIVAAKALAFATGAQLVGQDVLAPQCLAHTQATDDRRHLTLAVNDARRRQLYFALYDGGTVADGVGQSPITLIDMDIDYPDSITMRVNDVLTKLADTGKPYVVDVIGHGAVKYAQSWNAIASLGEVDDHALLDEGAEGLARFAAFTTSEQALAEPTPVEPLYLRRPDVSVPNPLKHVLNHAGAERTE